MLLLGSHFKILVRVQPYLLTLHQWTSGAFQMNECPRQVVYRKWTSWYLSFARWVSCDLRITNSQHLDLRRIPGEGLAACYSDNVSTSKRKCCGQTAVLLAFTIKRETAVLRVLKRAFLSLFSLVEPIGHKACQMHTVSSTLMPLLHELIKNCQSNQQFADKVHVL